MLEDERQRRACAVEERDAALQDRENKARSADGATLLVQARSRRRSPPRRTFLEPRWLTATGWSHGGWTTPGCDRPTQESRRPDG